jgi:predicted acylesterase/phospholipase RssA
MDPTTHVYVLPVSGGYFPLQIAELMWMAPSVPRPMLVLGSSGGNIAAYMATAGNWSPTGMERVVDAMYSGMFIKSWWPSYLPYLPSVLKGYFKGSAYNSNDEFINVFEALFVPESAATSLAATELWSGTYNTTAGATQLFCNRTQEDALLQPYPSSNELLNVVPPVYIDGNTQTMARVCVASAAVPAMFPPQSIGGSFYIDGGTAYSSPLTALRGELQRFYMGKNMHMTYFSPYNIQAPAYTVCYEPIMKGALSAQAECVPGTMYNQGVDAVSEILKSLMLQDRMAGVTLVGDPWELTYTEEHMSYDEFQAFQTRRLTLARSFVEVYPLSKEHISIVSFGPDDIRKTMASVTQLGVRAWLPTS